MQQAGLRQGPAGRASLCGGTFNSLSAESKVWCDGCMHHGAFGSYIRDVAGRRPGRGCQPLRSHKEQVRLYVQVGLGVGWLNRVE
jgi:hypothetical protein